MGVEFESSDGAAWQQQLEGYASLIQALNKPNLQEFDNFYTHSLPKLLQERRPSPFITTQELAKVVQWKLSRGKWRPRLLSYAQSLDEEEVKSASMTSFSALPDLKAAINALSALKGVGPATASAVLAAVAPDIAPFMSDEAMIAVLGGVKDYTLKQYLLFADKLQKKAQCIVGCISVYSWHVHCPRQVSDVSLACILSHGCSQNSPSIGAASSF